MVSRGCPTKTDVAPYAKPATKPLTSGIGIGVQALGRLPVRSSPAVYCRLLFSPPSVASCQQVWSTTNLVQFQTGGSLLGVHTEAFELGTNVCDTNCAGRSSLPVGCKFAPTVARCRLIRAPGLRFTMLRAMGTIFCLCALVFGQRLLSALGIERQDLVSVQLLVAEAHLSLGQVKEAKGLLSAAGRFRFHRSGCSF